MRISLPFKTKHSVRLRLAAAEGRLVHGFPVLRLLRGLRHPIASPAGVWPMLPTYPMRLPYSIGLPWFLDWHSNASV